MRNRDIIGGHTPSTRLPGCVPTFPETGCPDSVVDTRVSSERGDRSIYPRSQKARSLPETEANRTKVALLLFQKGSPSTSPRSLPPFSPPGLSRPSGLSHPDDGRHQAGLPASFTLVGAHTRGPSFVPAEVLDESSKNLSPGHVYPSVSRCNISAIAEHESAVTLFERDAVKATA